VFVGVIENGKDLHMKGLGFEYRWWEILNSAPEPVLEEGEE